MFDAANEAKGAISGYPDWAREKWADDDPDLPGGDGEPLYLKGDWRQPHTVRGLETTDGGLPYGMHTTTIT